MGRRLALVAALAVGVGCGDPSDELGSTRPTYDAHVAPLLARACVTCHSQWGHRAGGVELDRYPSAFGARIKLTCTAVSPELIEANRELLRPTPRQPTPADPISIRPPCEGWTPLSMPPDTLDRLSTHEQRLLLRWIELGAPR